MANTYTKFYLQAVFAVQYRENLINPKWEDELYKYITGIVQNHNHKMIAINGVSDHIHLFIGLKPHQAISDLMRLIKTNSSKWINERRFVKGRFAWQEGFGGFSYGHSQIKQVANYIQQQKHHHQRQSFKEEYLALLRKFEIEFSDDYVFEFFDDYNFS